MSHFNFHYYQNDEDLSQEELIFEDDDFPIGGGYSSAEPDNYDYSYEASMSYDQPLQNRTMNFMNEYSQQNQSDYLKNNNMQLINTNQGSTTAGEMDTFFSSLHETQPKVNNTSPTLDGPPSNLSAALPFSLEQEHVHYFECVSSYSNEVLVFTVDQFLANLDDASIEYHSQLLTWSITILSPHSLTVLQIQLRSYAIDQDSPMPPSASSSPSSTSVHSPGSLQRSASTTTNSNHQQIVVGVFLEGKEIYFLEIFDKLLRTLNETAQSTSVNKSESEDDLLLEETQNRSDNIKMPVALSQYEYFIQNISFLQEIVQGIQSNTNDSESVLEAVQTIYNLTKDIQMLELLCTTRAIETLLRLFSPSYIFSETKWLKSYAILALANLAVHRSALQIISNHTEAGVDDGFLLFLQSVCSYSPTELLRYGIVRQVRQKSELLLMAIQHIIDEQQQQQNQHMWNTGAMIHHQGLERAMQVSSFGQA